MLTGVLNTYRVHFVNADDGGEYTYYGDFESEEAACVECWNAYNVSLIVKVELVK